MRARTRSRAHQDIHAEILERRVEHLFHVGQQAMDLIHEKYLPGPYVAQNTGEIQFLLQDGTGGGRKCDFQFLGDDGGQRSLPQAGRSVEQHVVHRLAAHTRRLDGYRKVFLQLPLPGKVCQAMGTQPGFKRGVFGLAIPGNQAPLKHPCTSLTYQLQGAAK